MQITAATAADIPDLCELLSLLFAQELEFTPDRPAQARGLASIIAEPALGTVLIARRGAAALGMVNLLYTVSTALGERVALLEDMVVAPQARGAGVGAALLGRAREVAVAEGCKRITLLTDATNVAAQGFYEKHGYVASSMRPYRLSLD
jgi:GNAT superfamily N-acetyltransferase